MKTCLYSVCLQGRRWEVYKRRGERRHLFPPLFPPPPSISQGRFLWCLKPFTPPTLSRFKENSLGNQTPSAAAAGLLSYKTSFPKSPPVPPPRLPNNSPSLSATGKKEWSAFFSVPFLSFLSPTPLPLQRNVGIVFACWWQYLKGEICCCCCSWEIAGGDS